mmetsp:Transcript_10027/g.13121  ORF Transcript_10027/g.13121 Transcript_10027/m.13121 type:complete len:268 (-) Transcript_10027:593-1396(-)
MEEKLYPRKFYGKFLARGVRPDGRGTYEVRDTKISVGGIKSADGSAVVKIGNTTVQCGIRYKVTTPSVSAPFDGHVDVNVHLLPVCSTKYESSRPGEHSYVMGELLNRLTEKAKLIDNSELCIVEGKAVYVLQVDIICLNDDGNIIDASILALSAALRDTGLPTETRVEENGEIVQIGHDKTVKLKSQKLVTPLTFGIFDEKIISDPNEEESKIMDGFITVVLDEKKNVVLTKKHKGSGITYDHLQTCIEVCSKRIEEVKQLLSTKN